jgi:hypothetical protein
MMEPDEEAMGNYICEEISPASPRNSATTNTQLYTNEWSVQIKPNNKEATRTKPGLEGK